MAKVGIIGAGICGLQIAYDVLKSGHEPVIYEWMPYIGAGASGYNAGVIHVIQPPFKSIKSMLCLEGNREYPSLARELGFKIRFLKAYLVSRGVIRSPITYIASLYLRRMGYRVRYVGRKEVINGCRDVSKDIGGGIEVDGYAVVDPKDVLDSFYKYLRDRGVEFRLGDKVDSLSISRDGIHLYSSVEEVYDYVIIAAGGYTKDLAKDIDLEPPTQRFAKGVMVISKLDCDNIIARLELFSKERYTKGGGVIPRVDSETVLFGPTFKWTNEPMDNTVSEDEIVETITGYRDLINCEPEVISAYAGTRTLNWPIDDYIIKFLYGKIAILYGIDSPGFTASPAISKKVIERLKLDRI